MFENVWVPPPSSCRVKKTHFSARWVFVLPSSDLHIFDHFRIFYTQIRLTFHPLTKSKLKFYVSPPFFFRPDCVFPFIPSFRHRTIMSNETPPWSHHNDRFLVELSPLCHRLERTENTKWEIWLTWSLLSDRFLGYSDARKFHWLFVLYMFNFHKILGSIWKFWCNLNIRSQSLHLSHPLI